MNWGVFPIVIPRSETVSDSIAESIQKATAVGIVKINDLIIITAGVPMGIEGNTNLMRVHVIGRDI